MKRPTCRIYFMTRITLGERMIHWWGECSESEVVRGIVRETVRGGREPEEQEHWHSLDLPLWYRWANVWKVEAKITEVTGYRRR